MEKQFDAESKELIVLTETGAGAGKGWKEKLWTASVNILASVDPSAGVLNKETTVLEWPLTDEECRTEEKKFDIKGQKIYRLRVKESLPFQNPYNGAQMRRGYWLQLIEVLERGCREERLEKILAEYQKPVSLMTENCGELLLDKLLGMYHGETTWNGGKCQVHLDVDEDGSETAKDSLQTLEKLMEDSAGWDDKARRFAADKLTDLANDWQDSEYDEAETDGDENVITKEEFAKRLSASELCVSTEGDFEMYYNDDDMFWGHVVVVSGNIDSGMSDAQIEG